MEALLPEAQALFEYTRTLRRDLHRHPELGFKEVRTAGIVARGLGDLGLEVRSGVGKTGVVGLLEGTRPGPTVLLRFDMDALPVNEETGAEYASLTPGVMHACGHDGHVAVGLTVAHMLQSRRQELAGRVKLIFQPAEEGLGGAEAMIADGVLRDPVPDFALAFHLWNERRVGWLALVPGPLMAGAEIFTVHILGKGGHGALPNQAVDPLMAAAQVISALQSIVSRNISPLQNAVVSVTRLSAGDTFNVIPPSAMLQGTIRTFEPEVRQLVMERFQKLVRGVCEGLGCEVEIELKRLTPAVINDPAVVSRLTGLVPKALPDEQVDATFRTMVSEDMAEILEAVPGCYLMVGSANPERGLDAGHHHPRFDFDEAALPRAAAFMTAAALELLR